MGGGKDEREGRVERGDKAGAGLEKDIQNGEGRDGMDGSGRGEKQKNVRITKRDTGGKRDRLSARRYCLGVKS